jgi:hypothetical protein
MKGYVARKGDRWYAVIYDGLDPVTGRERRIWHPAGTDRADAERLAARLAADVNGRNDDVRGLSFGAYLTKRWPARAAGHAGRCRPHLRTTHCSSGSTVRRFYPFGPLEGPEEDRLRTVEALVSTTADQG